MGDYCETKLGTLPPHMFLHYAIGNPSYGNLPDHSTQGYKFKYLLKVYVDDFISLVILVSHEHLQHVSNGTMMRIHDVFPPNEISGNDPIFKKKLKQGDGEYATTKTILGFIFDGKQKQFGLRKPNERTSSRS
jgi:hypothetical protein